VQSLSINILMHIRIMYIALHESTSAALTRISIGNADFDPILVLPFSYPLCNTPAHTPGLPHRADKMAASVTSLNDHNPRNSYLTVLANDVTGTGNVADTPSVLTTNPSQIDIQVAGEPSPEHITRLCAECPPNLANPTYPSQVSAWNYIPTSTDLSGRTVAPQPNEDTLPSVVPETLTSGSPVLPFHNTLPGM